MRMLKYSLVALMIISCVACSKQNSLDTGQPTDGKVVKQGKQKPTLLSQLALGDYERDSLIHLIGKSDDYRIRAAELEVSTPIQHDEVYNRGLRVSYTKTNQREDIIKSLTFQKHYEDKIIDDLDMQTTMAELEERYGQPDFQDTERHLTGYRQQDYYLFVIGTESIESLTIYPVSDQQEILAHEKDPIFLQEMSRLMDEDTYRRMAKYHGKSSPSGKVKLLEAYAKNHGKFIRLYSEDGMEFYTELHRIDTYAWLEDELLLYLLEDGKYNLATDDRRYVLGVYDCKRQENMRLDVKQQPIELESFGEGYINYTSGDALGGIQYEIGEEGIRIK